MAQQSSSRLSMSAHMAALEIDPVQDHVGSTVFIKNGIGLIRIRVVVAVCKEWQLVSSVSATYVGQGRQDPFRGGRCRDCSARPSINAHRHSSSLTAGKGAKRSRASRVQDQQLGVDAILLVVSSSCVQTLTIVRDKPSLSTQ